MRLPDAYISLYDASLNDIMARHAMAYLKKRHVSKHDILKYNIGYCKEGPYKNMIILPTYDVDGKVKLFYWHVLLKKNLILNIETHKYQEI